MHIGPRRPGPEPGCKPQNHFLGELFGASKRQRRAILFLPARPVRATIGPNGLSRQDGRIRVPAGVCIALQLREEASRRYDAAGSSADTVG